MARRGIPMNLWAKNVLMGNLYDPANHYLLERKSKIIQENNLAHKDGSLIGEMRYRGKGYSNKSEYGYHYTAQYELAPTLYEKMDAWLKDRDDLMQEQEDVERYTSLLFASVKNFKDLTNILGDNLTTFFREHADKFSSVETDPNKIRDMMMRGKPYIEMMQNRLIDNLISRDLYGE